MTETTIYQKNDDIKMEKQEKFDIEGLIETIEIMSDPETMKAIKESEKDIAAGRVKEFTSMKDLLD
jgi:PHD/YefM family antitoxin component YafN of YafNO toxin-antitoxin module